MSFSRSPKLASTPPIDATPSLRAYRVAVFDTHPIQYFAPLWRGLAATPGLEVVVHFLSDHSVRGGVDPGFGVPVAWDIPLTEGYEHRFITRNVDFSRPRSVSIPHAAGLLRDGRFDCVLMHGYRFAFSRQVARAARGLGIGTVLRGEFSDVQPYGGRNSAKAFLRNLYLRWFYRYVDAFCYIGEEARMHLVRRGISSKRMFFSPYAVDAGLFEQQKQEFTRDAVRSELKIRDGQLVIVFSGKLIPRKAPMLLMQAIAKLPDASRVTVLMVGEGPLRAELDAAGRAILGDRLLVTGFVNQSQIGKYYSAADVFVLPSEFETWGLVVNEAMNFGLPVVVSSQVGCRRDLVIEGETGLSFEVGNAASLSRCLARFLSDPSLGPHMGRKAAAHIGQYSVDRSVSGIVEAVRAVGESKLQA